MNLEKVYGPQGRSVTGRQKWAWLDLISPVPCLACEEPSQGAGRAICLCLRCHGQLVSWPRAGCAVCGARLGDVPTTSGYRCRACRSSRPAYDSLVAAWRYGPPLDAVVGALKFGRLDFLGSALGIAAAQAWARSAPSDLPLEAVVVPVPLHWWRRLTRGYDQARLIAAGVASALGWSLVPALRRCRHTATQSRLPRAQRLVNPRGAFSIVARRKRQIVGRDVVLVDDVVTTGATVEACARCLRASGARSVTVLAVARAA